MFSMLPHPPYKIGWVVHDREITTFKNGKLRKKSKHKYYTTVFFQNGSSIESDFFDKYDDADAYGHFHYYGYW